MTDSPMSYIPTHLRHVPFGRAFTLNADDELMSVKLRSDLTFSRSLADYRIVEIDDYNEEEQVTLLLIHGTLLGEN